MLFLASFRERQLSHRTAQKSLPACLLTALHQYVDTSLEATMIPSHIILLGIGQQNQLVSQHIERVVLITRSAMYV